MTEHAGHSANRSASATSASGGAAPARDEQNRTYYDDFAGWYERERGKGYHRMLDDLEVELPTAAAETQEPRAEPAAHRRRRPAPRPGGTVRTRR